MSCNLSSTGLCDINANKVSADKVYVYSNLIVGGASHLKHLVINKIPTLLSLLHVSGFTTLGNNTTL